MRHLIDKSLAGEVSSHEQQHAFGEHLRACAQCESYAERRPPRHRRPQRFFLRRRSRLAGKNPRRPRPPRPAVASREPPSVWCALCQVTIAALVLTIAGSFGAVHMGDLLAAVLHLPVAQAQTGCSPSGSRPPGASLFCCPYCSSFRPGRRTGKDKSYET